MNLHEWEKFFAERVRGHSDLVKSYLVYVKNLQAKGLPPIFEFRHLSRLLNVEEGFLAAVVRDSSKLYREFSIPKRRGGRRRILAPQPSLLHCQRWVNKEVLQNLPISDRAFGFVSGRSAIDNAAEHLGADYLLNIDIRDFFPSIGSDTVLNAFLGLGYSPSVSLTLTEICCAFGSLPQGAATSPALSNFLCRTLDAELHDLAVSRGLRYSRYADDMSFSGPAIGSDIVNKAAFIISQFGYSINEQKLRLSGPKSKKIVTGISISSGRTKLPRNRVRMIKADAHTLLKLGPIGFLNAQEIPDPLAIERLLGRLEFWLQVDPKNSAALKIRERLIGVAHN
ncbi:reverse transcriptase family protein [Kordiimonas sp.]|uniref:reverse transcriptase family protein n=1 Tax=Kordiimonas sp. TaxID=1970157 RepID=UPI003A8EEB4A